VKRSVKFTRRRFLQRGIAATLTAASPLFIPRHVLGFGNQTGANEQIVVGVIGMGVRGTQLLLNVPASGRVASVCDADARKTAEAVNAHKATWRVDQDYRALLEQQDLDAVFVAACDHHHVLASILACQAGKHVYCEKPLLLYIREGRALVAAARKHGCVVQTGTQQRTMEMNRFTCEFMRDGGIGQIRAVECVNFKGPIAYPAEGLPAEPIPEGVDWNLWQGHPCYFFVLSIARMARPEHG